MTNQKLLFETQLVDGSKFRKFRKYLLWTGPAYMVLSMSIHIFWPSSKDLKWDTLTSSVAIIFYAIVIVSIILYYYSERIIPKGILKIGEEHIKIEKDKVSSFKIEDVNNFEIQRGSTYHYTHQTGNELIKFNNYLRFTYNDTSYEYEFCIDSKQKNTEFEAMIHTLQKNRINLYYT